ncbi:hypothetical protein [Actinomycetospora atypica]|uniref:Lipoprotein n=1 Tax=Actinomycetospora atypica TaxID=1290095 RepID=A0ABV9YKG8_9PSEU
MTTTGSARTRAGSSSTLTRLAATCAVAVCLLAGCADDTTTATDSAMSLTVSTVTDTPMVVWFDTRMRSRSGMLGRSLDPTPVALSPQRPSVVLPVPYERGYWLWVRVAGPPDRPAGTVVGCELRAADGRVLAVDASDPLGPPTDGAACAGAG